MMIEMFWVRIICHFSGQGYISWEFQKILHFWTGQESHKTPAGLLTKPKVQQSRYSRLTQSLFQSTCIVLWMNFAQVSPNNSEMTSDIASQIRGCDKQACFMSLLWFRVFILMGRNFDLCMLSDGGKTLFTVLSLSIRSVKLSHDIMCSYEPVWMTIKGFTFINTGLHRLQFYLKSCQK